jgi:hypothetical protein
MKQPNQIILPLLLLLLFITSDAFSQFNDRAINKRAIKKIDVDARGIGKHKILSENLWSNSTYKNISLLLDSLNATKLNRLSYKVVRDVLVAKSPPPKGHNPQIADFINVRANALYNMGYFTRADMLLARVDRQYKSVNTLVLQVKNNIMLNKWNIACQDVKEPLHRINTFKITQRLEMQKALFLCQYIHDDNLNAANLTLDFIANIIPQEDKFLPWARKIIDYKLQQKRLDTSKIIEKANLSDADWAILVLLNHSEGMGLESLYKTISYQSRLPLAYLWQQEFKSGYNDDLIYQAMLLDVISVSQYLAMMNERGSVTKADKRYKIISESVNYSQYINKGGDKQDNAWFWLDIDHLEPTKARFEELISSPYSEAKVIYKGYQSYRLHKQKIPPVLNINKQGESLLLSVLVLANPQDDQDVARSLVTLERLGFSRRFVKQLVINSIYAQL